MHKEKKESETARNIQKKLDELIKKKEQENALLKQFLPKDIKKENQ